MTDKVTPAARSKMMAAVRGKNTRPEHTVRTALFSAGYRYRLHRRDLPGAPDIVLPRFRTAVFVHGCFWHGHDCRRGGRPVSNVEFWNKKLDGNIARDQQNHAALRAAGWHVEVIWQCSLEAGCNRVLTRLKAIRVRSGDLLWSNERIDQVSGVELR
jgi:DNA mismatch endonuclease (patch repair protein)